MKRLIVITILLNLYCALSAQDAYYSRENISIPTEFGLSENVDAIVYPNPVTNGKFFVSSEYGITNIEVLNVIGQRIIMKEFNAYNNQEIVVELGNCEQGLYLVKISFVTDKTVIKKLLVK